MKTRLIALLLLVVFTASVISGCATASATQLDAPTQHIPQAEIADVVRTLNEPNPGLETAPTAMTQRITAQEAEHIALAHAGIAAADAHQLHTEFDYDDGTPEYSVEFHHNGWEYDYEIHAETGEILRNESEPEPTAPPATEPPATEHPVKEPTATEPPATEPPATEPPATEPPATEPADTRLSKEQVYAIALKHAGLSKDQVSRLKAEFDIDDGVPQYDVEFKYDGWEYEYEIHAESGKILRSHKERDDDAPAPTEPPATEPPATEPPATEPADTRLSKEQVYAIALKHAGLSKDQVSRLKAEFDIDDGVPQYDVEFKYDGWEYEYEIHAESGKILRSHKERDDDAPAPTEPPATEPPATEPADTRLSKEQVYAIALKHAGLSKDQVSRLKAEFDVDDGVPQYDVEFKYDGWEYEYEIHAESGKILRSHKERDDDAPAPTEPPATEPPATEPPATEPANTRLSKEQVYAIALKHAGLSKDQVSRLKAEFDVDDGLPQYDVEFKYDGWEYEYEIHAESGKILKWDKDRDD